MIDREHKLCVAPMMERTDRHCRFFLRLLSARAWLYTEMITAAALLKGDRSRLLELHPSEHPVALQLGGNRPEELALAARFGAEAGFDEINLNVGCPSDRVQAGCFGAALMLTPDAVAHCVEAMTRAVQIPVTVKTRLGVDEQDDYPFLRDFVTRVQSAGCRTVIVHARKAWLSGLSPKQNREVPPLDYRRVHRLKADFPQLEIVINGGLADVATALRQLRHVDGVMLGRAAYQDPWLLARLDTEILPAAVSCSRERALEAMLPYLAGELEQGTSLKAMTRHLMGLYAGQPDGRRWRRALSELPSGDRGLEQLERLVLDRRARAAARHDWVAATGRSDASRDSPRRTIRG